MSSILARQLKRAPVAKAPAEIRLYGDIGDGKCTGEGVKAMLSGVSGDVAVRVNSDGGVVTQGVAIYHELRRHKGKVVTYCDGLAASIASIIFQAGEERHIARGAYVMIHNPSSPAGGESSDLRKTADVLDRMRDDMVSIYCSRTGQTRETIEQMMTEETYLNADQAIEMGFADVIDEVDAQIELRAVAKLARGPNSKLPEALSALLEKGSKMTAEEEKEMRAQLEALTAENAKLKAEKSDDSDEDDEKPHDEDDDKDDDKEEAKAVLAAARRITGKRSAAEVEGALMALGAAKFQSRASDVDELIKAGKLAPSDRDWATKASPKAFEAYKSAVGKSQVAPIGHRFAEPRADGAPPVSDELTAAEKAAVKAGLPKDLVIRARAAAPIARMSDAPETN